MINIGLYLLGQKGYECLNSILEKKNYLLDFQISFVEYSTDLNIENDFSEEIIKICVDKKVKYHKRNENNFLESDINIAIGWRWLITNDIDKLVVLHDSILPKYRGFNPLVTALIEGDNEIGATALKANAEFDKGNIVGVKTTTISYPIKIKDAIDIVSQLYVELVLDVIQNKIENKLIETIQNDDNSSYSLWRDDEDYIINWNQNSETIVRTINAVGAPYKGTSCVYDNKKIRIIDAQTIEDLSIVNRTSGKILAIKDNKPIVVCKKGLVQINKAEYDDSKTKVLFNKLRIRL